MRDIKFRAWNNAFGMEFFDLKRLNEESISFYKNTISNVDCNIMQYTRLKDKNGREIYEGDIVEVDNGREWHRFKVLFFNGGYKLARLQDRLKIVMLLEIPCRNKDIKVIGNIYENPELLA